MTIDEQNISISALYKYAYILSYQITIIKNANNKLPKYSILKKSDDINQSKKAVEYCKQSVKLGNQMIFLCKFVKKW